MAIGAARPYSGAWLHAGSQCVVAQCVGAHRHRGIGVLVTAFSYVLLWYWGRVVVKGLIGIPALWAWWYGALR